MSETVQLQAEDGHILDAYVARPMGTPIGSLVILQEIFGVNGSIRDVADSYAKDGFFVVAPALFDRYEKKVELGYGRDDVQKAFTLLQKLSVNTALLDVQASLSYAENETGKKAAVLGFCYGGKLAWLASTRLRPSAAVGYYAGGIGEFASETPNAPTILHFGSKDTHIPREQVEKVTTAHADVPVYWYDADHAFANHVRPSYNSAAADLARERSLAFLKEHPGQAKAAFAETIRAKRDHEPFLS